MQRGPGRVVAAATVATFVALIVAVTGAALAASYLDVHHRATATSTDVEQYGSAPHYSLTDQHGRTFSSKQLRGQVQVVSYLFPYCTSYCPLIARTLAQTEHLVDQHGLRGKVSFVAFNVDPGGAGPPILSQFLHQEGINPNDLAWHYLTGTPQQVTHVVRDGFHVYYQKVTLAQEQKAEVQQKKAGTYTPQPDEPNRIAARAHVDYDIVHNDTIEIVDPHGIIRTFIDSGDTASPTQLYTAITHALHH